MTKLLGTREVYGDTLSELGAVNKNIVVLDADLSGSTKTSVFAKKFPDRFFNMGVSEADMMGTAAGLSTCGKIPFASTFAIFASGRAWEQVRQSIAYPKLNVKIVASHGGITVGEDGASHQAIEDIALMRCIPNMTVIMPCDGIETKSVIHEIVKYNGPVYVRVARGKFPVVMPEDYKFSIGKGVVVRNGKDATIIAMGLMVSHAIEAAAMLEKEGLNIRVINMSTIKPIDRDLIIKAAKETGAIITAEEHSIIGGLGEAVAGVVAEEFPVPMKRVGIQDKFGQSGLAEELLAHYGLMPKDIAVAVREVVKKK
ncbi:MAG TPA: transketolase [Deltaproteobacteria bacterium]|nr:MAG: transketolase [Deltaproteobacteria bacterium GWA2_42_85]OGP43213.1 MAG: transketolase [Deltaproteobacteria bacterium GWD2_42_10]OGP45943.1 MAG: transketolase [Deltaproteobacteria bacterium GWF2_42_12]OGQ37068.1 MAG: transketolase [Deltaproteobacteria bacterium RIFCSPLOWO2_02_FULL_42_39]OGQ66712.1 MAG: transketolase [Deltaproteobacteria bacterium RIFCSPLOWO2_12_FULL_42_16]HAG51414.1 transketolase [Deltaproteobacteria bacterium]